METLAVPHVSLPRFRAPSRRDLLAGGAALGVLPFAVPTTAWAQGGPAEVPVDELMKPGDQPDLVLGKPDAKVVIVEYASMTCGHCANFHNTVLPTLKQKYIDPGKVRMILREFPLDNLAAAGAMLARCVEPDKATGLIETLFKRQDEWVVRGNPVPKLFDIVKGLGFTQETFDKCLTNQKLLEAVTSSRSRASEKFGVSSTPTFFINGKRFTGNQTVAEFEKVLEPLTKG